MMISINAQRRRAEMISDDNNFAQIIYVGCIERLSWKKEIY